MEYHEHETGDTIAKGAADHQPQRKQKHISPPSPSVYQLSFQGYPDDYQELKIVLL